jgi:hypothetical protein
VESLAAAYLENQRVKREIALVNLNLQAVRAGLTSAWEVTLYPEAGNPDFARWVVVLGRTSDDAIAQALGMNPGFVAVSARRVSR